MKKKEDRRILYTRNIIKETFLSLLEEKNIDKITVKELCEKADINRATFYYHFNDMPSLITTIEVEIANNMLDLINPSSRSNSPFMESYLALITNNKSFYKAFFNRNLKSKAIEIVLSNFKEQYLLKKSANNTQAEKLFLEYRFEFVSKGYAGIIRKWLNSGCKESPEDMLDVIKQILK